MLLYVDDTGLGNEVKEEYMHSLSEILKLSCLKAVRSKLNKGSYKEREVKVLGCRVGPTEVSISDGHVRADRSLMGPACRDELMRSLELVSYFARFVDHFAEQYRSLYDILKRTWFYKHCQKEQRLIIQG